MFVDDDDDDDDDFKDYTHQYIGSFGSISGESCSQPANIYEAMTPGFEHSE